MENNKGFFLVFEGIDGAGKTTQIKRLAAWLEDQNLKYLVTKEPGGTTVGQGIRKIVLEAAQLDPKAEALLYAADRAQHIQETIIPALQAGKIVISDRYVDSSIAYQSAGRNLAEDKIKFLSTWATSDLKPDLTIVLDLPVQQAHRRLDARKQFADRMESENKTFHEFVKQKFLDLAKKNPKQYRLIDASLDITTITKEIEQIVTDLLSEAENFRQT